MASIKKVGILLSLFTQLYVQGTLAQEFQTPEFSDGQSDVPAMLLCGYLAEKYEFDPDAQELIIDLMIGTGVTPDKMDRWESDSVNFIATTMDGREPIDVWRENICEMRLRLIRLRLRPHEPPHYDTMEFRNPGESRIPMIYLCNYIGNQTGLEPRMKEILSNFFSYLGTPKSLLDEWEEDALTFVSKEVSQLGDLKKYWYENCDDPVRNMKSPIEVR
ncbi:hypothetical protein AAFN47_27910 [Hoeflea sp. CAU 1731]